MQDHDKRAEPAPSPEVGPPSPSSLVVGAVSDPAERNADRLADQVVRALQASAPPSVPPSSSRLARSALAASTARRSPLDTTPEASLDARSEASLDTDDVDDDVDLDDFLDENVAGPARVMRSPLASSGPGPIGAEGGPVPTDVEQRIRRSAGTPLEAGVRSDMEGAFGRDFASVRVHQGNEATRLNEALSAEAFTTGSDVFLRRQLDPANQRDQRLLAHELAHVVQQGAPVAAARSAQRSPRVVRREFVSADVRSNAHLRDGDDWGSFHGPKIKSGAKVLVNNTAPVTRGRYDWLPAVNTDLESWGLPIAPEQRGYIRGSRVRPDGGDVHAELTELIRTVLVQTEEVHPMIGGQLAKDEHIAFLVDDALRVPVWNAANTKADDFAAGFEGVLTKLGRIREGADYLAESIDHWLAWMHPDRKTMVWDLTLMKSDLHEEGLGVAKIEFRKSPGPPGHKFAAETTVVAMLKPEDKSLEAALLGDDATSAANQINEIVGLDDVDEMLTTIRMEATAHHGTLVEAVRGTEAGKLPDGPHAAKAVFHETLVFAFLAGLDDLHGENVFWHEGRPYLIDADNAMIRNQMEKTGSGTIAQTGFNRWNEGEADANQTAVTTGDNSVIQSRILDAMLTSQPKRIAIAQVLRDALTAKTGRVVPIASRFWGGQLNYWVIQEQYREQNLDMSSSEQVMVGRDGQYDSAVGAGLIGVAGENLVDRQYHQAVEKEEQRKDFTAGVIPFYEYEFSSGQVTHNGQHIWNGLTVDQAIGILLDRFDPTGQSRAAAGL